MKFETIKSLILTILVGGSIFLTWSIWTYKPSYDQIKQDVTNAPISDTKSIQELIKPNKILLNQNHTHLGTVNAVEIDRIINELQGWHFFDIENPKNVSASEIRNLTQANNHMDIEFPSRVPFEVYKGILQINKKQPSSVFFDRIVIDFEKGSQKEKNVYFIDTYNEKMASSTVSNNEIQSFLNKTKQKQSVYDPYEAVQLAQNHIVFLPKSTTNIQKYEYSLKDKDELEDFKKYLFSDPDSVQKSESKDKVEYINSSSLMRADLTNNTFLFVNPAEENMDYTSDPRNLIKQSIDFVNGHGGWTDQFQYFALDNDAHEVDFRLFMDGYPVFNEDGLAEIQQYWGETDIYQYRRPFVSLLDVQLNSSPKSLESGKDVLKSLLEIPHVQLDSIEDLEIGYTEKGIKLEKDPNNQEIISFEPTWYCLYDGTWSPVSEIGRVQDGME